MNTKRRIGDALILEDFDIIELSKFNPDQEIGVSVSSIHIQIAKYSNSSLHKSEIRLLLNALCNCDNKRNTNSRYVIMQIKDIMQCFGKNLRALPKSTFIQTSNLKGQCKLG